MSLAREISRTCLDRLASAPADQKYWLAATLAEAALILAASNDPNSSSGVWRDVERLYREARELAAGNFGHVFSTWRNARIILRHLPSSVAERIERAFAVPRVAVFAGHRVNRPGRTTPRLPAEILPQVKAAIHRKTCPLQYWRGFLVAAWVPTSFFWKPCRSLAARPTLCCRAIRSSSSRKA